MKIYPALRQAKLKALVNASAGKPSRREIIELRAGRAKKPHRKTQELLVPILKKLGLI